MHQATLLVYMVGRTRPRSYPRVIRPGKTALRRPYAPATTRLYLHHTRTVRRCKGTGTGACFPYMVGRSIISRVV